MGDRDGLTSRRIGFWAAALLGGYALFQAVATNNFPDLFIYRIGPVLMAEGKTPYDVPLVRQRVAAQFPDPDPKPESFVNNCGYFPPPLAIMVYLPFALVPWLWAKVLWAVVTALTAFAIARLPDQFREPGTPPAPRTLVWIIVPLALVLNPLAVATVVVGQTPLLLVGCVTAGQMCFEWIGRSRTNAEQLEADEDWDALRRLNWARTLAFWLGTVLWAIPFVKPHLALPLIVLAWYLGGWKRAAALVAVVAALNLIGATLVGGSPLYLKDYLDYLPTAHKTVLYNRAELNPQITSWNRLLFALTQPSERFLVELNAVTTLAGYLVWAGLVLGRAAATGVRPSASWALAAAVAGALTCCQVLGYELLALTLVIPWLRDLFAGGWKLRGWIAVLLLLSQQIPLEVFEKIGMDFHRSLGALVLAVLVLIGPVRTLGPQRDARA